MLSDQRHSGCSSCWNLEDNGVESERVIHNRSFDFYKDKDIEVIIDDAVNGKATPQIIKIATSNLCNGTCVTCGSLHSSAWASLEKKKTFLIKSNLKPLETVNWKEIVQLSFVGGEPFLEKSNFDILQNLINVGNTDCFISIVTNGSVELKQSYLEILSKFKNLNVCFSIDAIEEKFEYIRNPISWKSLLENLEKIKIFTKNISVSCTVSNLNIMYLDETIEFFEQQKIKYHCKNVASPAMFSPGNLPDEVKSAIANKELKHKDHVMSFLKINTFSTELFNNFWKEIDRQDQLKNISINNWLPEVAATRIYDTFQISQEM